MSNFSLCHSMLGTIALMVGIALPLRAQAQAPAPAERTSDSAHVRSLPTIELAAKDTGRTFVVFLSGDGGWADIDKKVAERLAEHGMPVVGLNLRDYLKDQKTPDQLSHDVARVIRTYGQKYNRDRVVVVGFSRGANLAPFALSRLPDDLRARVSLVTLIGLNRAANFKWHFQDVFRDVKRADDVPTLPEVEKLSAMHVRCVYGADEGESGCRDTPSWVRRVERSGGHHLDGDYRAIADLVADAVER